ncbi:MAG: hypothetical protein EON58_12995, partial [Alphaproteobacteria bacterium]
MQESPLHPVPGSEVLTRCDYKRPLDRLIYARCLVMDRHPKAGERLCNFVFHQDVLDRVARMSRNGRKVLFNATWVKSVTMDELVDVLTGVGQR